MKFSNLINHHLKVDMICPLCVCIYKFMLQELNDVMKMELIAGKECSEIKQVRC
jgi:hypothetical protein